MTKMRSDSPTAWDMLTHDEKMTVPKRPDVPYGFILNPEKAQAERAASYARQKKGEYCECRQKNGEYCECRHLSLRF